MPLVLVGGLYVLLLEPTFVQPLVPLALLCHWIVQAPVPPDTFAVSVTASPMHAVLLVGVILIVGSGVTVSVPITHDDPQEFVETTRYMWSPAAVMPETEREVDVGLAYEAPAGVPLDKLIHVVPL